MKKLSDPLLWGLKLAGGPTGSRFIQVGVTRARKASLRRWHLIRALASLVAQRVKRLPAMQEAWVRPLGQEDPMEKEIATHSITLAWKIPWTERPGRLQSMGSQRVRHD